MGKVQNESLWRAQSFLYLSLLETSAAKSRGWSELTIILPPILKCWDGKPATILGFFIFSIRIESILAFEVQLGNLSDMHTIKHNR